MKVMQTVYTLSTLETGSKPGEPVKALQKHFDQSKDLLLYLTYFLAEVAGYAEQDSFQRRSKHLPSVEDMNVNRGCISALVASVLRSPISTTFG